MSAESEKLLSDFEHAKPWTGEQDVLGQKLRALIDRLESEKQAAEAKLATATEALRSVAGWETPETGMFWSDGTPMSYGAAHGSNGERDYLKQLASNALTQIEQPQGEDAR